MNKFPNSKFEEIILQKNQKFVEIFIVIKRHLKKEKNSYTTVRGDQKQLFTIQLKS